MLRSGFGAVVLIFALAVACGGNIDEGRTTSTTVQPPETTPPATTASPTTTDPTMPETTTSTAKPPDIGTLERAAVKIDLEQRDGDEWKWLGGGSGSVVTPDGLILTNAHVVRPRAPGRAVAEGAVPGTPNPDRLVISVLQDTNAPPVRTYLAEVRTVEGYLDLAVLEITETIDGRPVDALDLNFVELGDSDDLQRFDRVRVLGYPGIGGGGLIATEGTVSGFDTEPRDPSLGRVWIQTDAALNPGNSGGMALDDEGRLIGVPTRAGAIVEAGGEIVDFSDLDTLRPINLAKGLIDDAHSGITYEQFTPLVGLANSADFRFVRWADKREGEGCPGGEVDPESKRLYAVVEYSGVPDGLDYLWLMLRKRDDEVVQRRLNVWRFGASGDCVFFPYSADDGETLGDGTYIFGLLAGPSLEVVLTRSIDLDAVTPAEGVQYTGRVVDGDSGKGIENAFVFILEPGVDSAGWLAAEELDSGRLVASGKTDAEGRYKLTDLLEPGVSYPCAFAAAGYRSFTDCKLTVPADAQGDRTIKDVTLFK